ncbi:MAG TPA: response regulator [Treponemataceae bacterium]|nr:response regulator [Treponemataceae bacterium]
MGDFDLGQYLTNSLVPFVVLTPNLDPESWNAAAEKLIASPAGGANPLTSQNLRAFIKAHCADEDRLRLEYLLDNRIPHFSFEALVSQSADARQWLKCIVSLQHDGRWFAIVDDISQQKMKERHLMVAKEDAEKASSTRSQFLANISHEIRTPIQTIIGTMELLEETRLDGEQTEYTRQVKFSADVLLSLINDILDFSKVEAGRMKIESIEFPLVERVEKTVDLVSMEAHKKGLEILVDVASEVPDYVIGDPNRLQQVVLNLVKNAVKFTERGSMIVRVAVTPAKQQTKIPARGAQALHDPLGEHLHFEVIDTGIGISDEAKKRLFTIFYQADASTTRRFGGTGLGLAISKNIVDLMGGEIGVRDRDGGGSVFWFDVPLARSERKPEAAPIAVNPGTRFLLVDDNAETLAVLARMLGDLGYRNVETAPSGMFALAMMRAAQHARRPFDIVFIDMVMPEMDGWRLAAEINGNRAINQAQLYLMVPEGTLGANAKMKLLDWFNGYLYKPLKRQMLANLLTEHWQSTIDLEIVETLESVDDEESPAALKPSPASTQPKASEAIAQTAPAPAPAFPGLTVLVAEDHPVNRKLLDMLLKKLGVTVVLAGDGEEAVEAMGKGEIDLVFMDIQMPKLNGYQATQWLREHGYHQPIIACTASGQEDERERCLSYGMTDVLPKPFKRQEIVEVIERWASGRVAEDREAFDSRELMDIMMGDATAARMLASEFIEQTEAHLGALAEDIDSLNLDAARQTAHLVKGSASNVTARRLAEAAREIETLAQDPRDNAMRGPLSDALSRARAALAEFKAATADFRLGGSANKENA